jgi:phenylacetate-CoA ligase
MAGAKGAGVFDTGIRQLRMALAMVWGRRLDTDNLVRLIADARATIAEFGEPGTDVEALIDGPQADPAARDHFARTNIRRTARRLDATSPFYARRFAAADVDARTFDPAALRRLPVTLKADLIRQADDFLCTGVERHLATRTTGTTGRPAEIWLSRYETELYPALLALGAVLRSVLRPTDIMQVNVSSRATISMHMDVAVCRLSGAGCRLIGIVPPDEALDSLGDGRVTILSTVASYLGELLVAARRRGLGPADFPHLRRIESGGEVLSATVAQAARETFGVTQVLDSFGMTEVIPVTGTTCDQGHLHHDINRGFVEYLDLDTGDPAEPGALATVVISPYYPYRDCMPVFRYDTRDLVRRLPDEPLTCSLAALPGCSKILGKADQLLRMPGREVVTPRQFIEAIDALPTRPWPARFAAAADGDRLTLTLPEYAVAGFGHADAVRHFADHGLDVDLRLVPDEDASGLRPLRCDLRETTFVARPALIGA